MENTKHVIFLNVPPPTPRKQKEKEQVRQWKGKKGNGMEWKGREGTGREGKGKGREGKGREGMEVNGREEKGREENGKGREGKERKGKGVTNKRVLTTPFPGLSSQDRPLDLNTQRTRIIHRVVSPNNTLHTLTIQIYVKVHKKLLYAIPLDMFEQNPWNLHVKLLLNILIMTCKNVDNYKTYQTPEQQVLGKERLTGRAKFTNTTTCKYKFITFLL